VLERYKHVQSAIDFQSMVASVFCLKKLAFRLPLLSNSNAESTVALLLNNKERARNNLNNDGAGFLLLTQ
jgi:hypothetical protein